MNIWIPPAAKEVTAGEGRRDSLAPGPAPSSLVRLAGQGGSCSAPARLARESIQDGQYRSIIDVSYQVLFIITQMVIITGH